MKEIVGTLLALVSGVVIFFVSKNELSPEQFEMVKFTLSSVFYLYIAFGFAYYAYKYHALKNSLSGKPKE